MTVKPIGIDYVVPPYNVPLVNPDGTMNLVWYRFFIALFNQSGMNIPGLYSTANRLSDARGTFGVGNSFTVQTALLKEDTNLYSLAVYENDTGQQFTPDGVTGNKLFFTNPP